MESVKTLVTSEGSDAAPQYVGVGHGWSWENSSSSKTVWKPNGERPFSRSNVHLVHCGETPDIMTLYRSLSKKLGLNPELYVNPEDYKRYLHAQFIQKRMFLVLDDVWKDKTFDSLNLAKGDRSVTLLTTRNLSLLEKTSPHISHKAY